MHAESPTNPLGLRPHLRRLLRRPLARFRATRAGRAAADLRWRLRRARQLRAVRARVLARGTTTRLRWAIKTSVAADRSGDFWGDLYFAQDLAAALEELGQEVYVDRLTVRDRPDDRPDDVVLVLRGLHAVAFEPDALNVYWVISHPDLVPELELSRFADVAFAAGSRWAEQTGARLGIRIHPLLQATNPARFHPGPRTDELASDVLFVGKTRYVFRAIVRDAIAAGAELTVHGEGWREFIPAEHVRSDHLDNELLPDAYRSARIVLNDHWEDMRRWGFLSNRLFDATACGARVITDDIGDDAALFGGMVRSYRDLDEFRELLAREASWPDAAERAELGRRIGQDHSFRRRAEVLLAMARAELGLRAAGRR